MPGGPSAYAADTSQMGAESELTGVLVVVAERCYGLENVDGVQFAVVFPAGTQTTDGGVILPDGSVVSLGERIDGGGGYFENSPEIEQSGMPPECLTPGAGVMSNAAAG